MFLFVCLQFCGCSTDNIGVFGTFGCKTLAIMLICIGDGIRDSLIIHHRQASWPTETEHPHPCHMLRTGNPYACKI